MNSRIGFIAAALSVTLGAGAANAAEVSTDGGLKVVSDDGQSSIQIGGRLHLDAAWFDEDGSDVEDANTEVRRARLYAKGVIDGDFEYKLQFDFAGGDTATKDLYVKHKPSGLIAGHFKQPFSLEELVSSNYNTFLERALPVQLATSRRLGLGWSTQGDDYSFMASIYDRAADGGTEGSGIGARATWVPWSGEDRLLHLGVAAAVEGPSNDDNDTHRFRARPEAHLANRLIDTGTLTDVDDVTKLGLEAAWVQGPFSLQGEYIAASASRDQQSDVDVSGYYVQASYFLTGESRPYRKGAFNQVIPRASRGGWELAARFSTLDLNDGSVLGGEEDNLTLGVNYYINKNLRIMTNVVFVDAEVGGVSTEPRIVQVRGQLTF